MRAHESVRGPARRRQSIGRVGAAVLCLLGAGGRSEAQERPVQWSFSAALLPKLDSGDTVSIPLLARIHEGWYLYSLTQPPGGPIRTTIDLLADSPYRLAGPIQSPEPEEYPDRNFNIFSQVYQDSVTFTIPVQAVDGAGSGARGLIALVRYQTCNDRYCLPPRTDTLALALLGADPAFSVPEPSGPVSVATPDAAISTEAEDAPVLGTPADADTSESGGISLTARSQSAPEKGPLPPTAGATAAAPPVEGETTDSLVRFLLLAASFGLLSLLTPCVFPLIPITVGFFTKRTGAARTTDFRAALAFTLGIIGTFSALGLGVALLFGAGGIVRLAANPWLNLAIAALFVAFALNLLGVWHVSLPAKLVSRAAGTGDRVAGTPAAVLMGGTFSLTSFTCTAPLVGTLLVLSTQGSWRWPLLGLVAYAAAFALPFFLLALVPGTLARLPRSGPWMVTLKSTLGVLELAAAVKFVSNADLVWHWGVLTREVMIGLWIAAALSLSAALLLQSRARRLPRPGWKRGLLALSSLAGAAWLATGLGGSRLGELEAYLPPARGGEDTELPWLLNDYDGSLQMARREGRPLMIDYTGYTCTNCRWMEANMFPRPEVNARLQGFVRVRLFTDGQGSLYERQQALQQQLFGTVALPYYAILAPSGEPVATFLGMTRDESEFVRFLERGLAAPSPSRQAAAPGT